MTSIGVDAPWSVAWSSEMAFRVIPSRDFPGLLEVDQKQSIGEGEPVFAMVHVTRQRRGMVDFICHVCGRRTWPDNRYIFPAASGGMVTLHDGTQQYGLNVPPMHLECAGRAAAACPHLLKVDEPPLKCTLDPGRLIHRTDVVPGMEGVAKTLPPGAEVVFACYRLYGPAFTAQVQAARQAWEAEARARRAERGRERPGS